MFSQLPGVAGGVLLQPLANAASATTTVDRTSSAGLAIGIQNYLGGE
jgi:hypothetical protein